MTARLVLGIVGTIAALAVAGCGSKPKHEFEPPTGMGLARTFAAYLHAQSALHYHYRADNAFCTFNDGDHTGVCDMQIRVTFKNFLGNGPVAFIQKWHTDWRCTKTWLCHVVDERETQ